MSRGRRWARDAAFAALALFLMLNVHEIGHTFFARLFGDGSARYALYHLRPDGGLACIGCNHYDETALSFWGNLFVTLGGVIFSQILALISLWLGGRTVNRPAKRFWGILAFVCLFDVVFQAAQGLAAHTAIQTSLTRVDIADFVWLVANRTGATPAAVKGGVAALLVLYLGGVARGRSALRRFGEA